jgi:hypothetical protein
MRQALIRATDSALSSVLEPRFFATERGFHGRFYCSLQGELERLGILSGGLLLEMEYQKSTRHSTGQRPDIVLHVPTEHSGADTKANNVCVWALKHNASPSGAGADFHKLDDMFRTLHYPLGIFINVSAVDNHLASYSGAFRDRVVTVAVLLNGQESVRAWSHSEL